MNTSEVRLRELAGGILLREFGVTVPWFISRARLFRRLPRSRFSYPFGDHWPMLRISVCGYSADWGFNFLSDRDSRFTEIQFRNDRAHSPKRTYRRSAARLHAWLGRPNRVNLPRAGQQTWVTDELWIDNWFVPGTRLPGGARVPVHTLSIRRRWD